VGDIANAIEMTVRPHGYAVVEDLGGHSVGHSVHEEPFIPNFGKAGTGAPLKTGMVLALEPIVNLKSKEIDLDDDGYTFKTADGELSAHFEHTIVITDDGAEILTKG